MSDSISASADSLVDMQACLHADTAARDSLLATTQSLIPSVDTAPVSVSDTAGGWDWVAWVALAIAVVSCVWLRKLMACIRKELTDLKDCLGKMDTVMVDIRAMMENLDHENTEQVKRPNECTKRIEVMTSTKTTFHDSGRDGAGSTRR